MQTLSDIRISSMLLCRRVLCPSVVPFSPHWTGRRTVELHDASHFCHSAPNSASVATSPCQHRTTSSTKESCHRQTGGEASAHESWPLHHDISNPPQLCLPSRKPLWHQLEPVEINCQWRESWKSATVRWSMPTSWTTHNPTAGFCSPLTTVVSPEPLPHQTRSLRCL